MALVIEYIQPSLKCLLQTLEVLQIWHYMFPQNLISFWENTMACDL